MIIKCPPFHSAHYAFWDRVQQLAWDVPVELVPFTLPHSVDEIEVDDERGWDIEGWCESVGGFSDGPYPALNFFYKKSFS
jgi:hypothetical protein